MIGLESSHWTMAEVAASPDEPICPGFIDGTCPIPELHDAGLYCWDDRAPSRYLREVLARYGATDAFEGTFPPPDIWWDLAQNILGAATDDETAELVSYMLWHCPQFRRQFRAAQLAELDVSRSAIHRRRRHLSVAEEQRPVPSYRPGRIVTTNVFVSTNPPLSEWYLCMGFLPPLEAPLDGHTPDWGTYPPCASALCPVPYPHLQGPMVDLGVLNHPTVLIPGPTAHLVEDLDSYGFGDLFPPGSRPPLFVLDAVMQVLEDGPESEALDIVERFRFFHCRGVRPIVGPGEEVDDYEEDVEEAATPLLSSSSGERDVEDTSMEGFQFCPWYMRCHSS